MAISNSTELVRQEIVRYEFSHKLNRAISLAPILARTVPRTIPLEVIQLYTVVGWISELRGLGQPKLRRSAKPSHTLLQKRSSEIKEQQANEREHEVRHIRKSLHQ